MNNRFDRIEAQLQRFIEGHTDHLFRSIEIEKKLAHRLVQAMQAQLKEQEDGRMVAPTLYTLFIHPHYAKDVNANTVLLKKLAIDMQESSEKYGVVFQAAPEIAVIPDGAVPKGEFKIQAIGFDDVLEETKGITVGNPIESDMMPEKAFMIVAGGKIISLEENIINIGRHLDNHLVLEDARVSRQHAQLRALDGAYILFDLDSYGGNFVNGIKVNQATLQPGDVVSLAGVTLVYGEDAIQSWEETQEYRLTPSDPDAPNSETLLSGQ